MSDLPPYPPIEPTNFNLIVIGTGLPESVISAAASTSGKSVLHLDPNPFYGSHFSSLSISDLVNFLSSHSTASYDSHDLITRLLYSDVEISNFAPELFSEHSRKFNLDLSGPRVLFCADKSVDLMLKSGSSHYVEFKSIDASFMGDADGKLSSVPDSRAAIFKGKTLGLMVKNQLMRFFKLVQGHLSANESEENNVRISEEDLEIPFAEFLTKMKLPHKIKSIVLYAIAMADYDQETTEVSENVLKTKDGINQLALYNSSDGRFQNARGALIYPIYGQGELPQAFCRRAAIKGCLYVSIADALKPDLSNFMVIYPPRSLFPERATSIRVLQLGGNLAVCPPGMFVLYFSALCDEVNQGKKLLHAALNALQKLLITESAESSSTSQSADAEEVKPDSLWSALYIQDLSMGQFGSISSTPMPDGNLNYNDLLDATEELFQKMYPNEEFFPQIGSPQNPEDDDTDLTLET